jgi:hypothetical protein
MSQVLETQTWLKKERDQGRVGETKKVRIAEVRDAKKRQERRVQCQGIKL